MKKIVTASIFFCYTILLSAQESNPFFVYRKGQIVDLFYTTDIRQILFTTEKFAGKEPITFQEVKTRLSSSKIPVAEIDSVSFMPPLAHAFKNPGKVNAITQNAFKELVWNYTSHPNELVFLGDKPVIVDYWAPWCKYCLDMMPLMEQLAQEYKGRVDFYKVDTDKEIELSNVLGMTSLPCFYFYPMKGQPAVRLGMMDLPSMRHIIENVLLITNDEDPEATKPVIEAEMWKGDINHEWTDRKLSVHIQCTSKNATLIKYGCFKENFFIESDLTEREFIQQFGEVMSTDLLPQINDSKGLDMVFPAQKGIEYRFFCLAKNAQGGVETVTRQSRTDEKYTPLLDLQIRQGAIAERIEDKKKHMTFYLKCDHASEAKYLCIKKEEYTQHLHSGKSDVQILSDAGIRLRPHELEQANKTGYDVSIGHLEEMTDYVCMGYACNNSGKFSVMKEELTTPFDEYNDLIPYPEISLITSTYDHGFSCSFSCSSSDATEAKLLMLPSDELTNLLAQSLTLEEVINKHSSANNITGEQLEWVNGQGISNVYLDVAPDKRYTCLAYVKGKFGGSKVVRSDAETLPSNLKKAPIEIRLTVSRNENMLYASAVCQTGNAQSATAVILESQALEAMLAAGTALEEIVRQNTPKILQETTFNADQLSWFNTGGFVIGYSGIKMNIRYSCVINVTDNNGNLAVKRVEYQTPMEGY